MATGKALRKEEPRPFALRSIFLRSSSVWISPEFSPLVPGQQLAPVMRSGEIRIEGNETRLLTEEAAEQRVNSCAFTLHFDFGYTLVGGPKADSNEEVEKAMVAKVSADITVDYLVNTPEFPSEERLQKWANSNTVVHAWPYWREYCHSTLLRMNLPVAIMPLLELMPPPDEAAASEMPVHAEPPPGKQASKPKTRTKEAGAASKTRTKT